MKPLLFLLLALPVTSPAAIVITEVLSSSLHGGGTNNADWFEITNTGPGAVDFTGWTWNDSDISDANTSLTAIGSLLGGKSVVITGEPVGTESSWISNWGLAGVTVIHQGSGFHNFSSDGDSIQIFDGTSTPVANVTFSTATSGRSFEWDTAGNSLGTSVAGENGAFVSPSNGQTTGNGPGSDVGSPGTAVPEPSSALFGGLAAVAFLGRRRKA